MTISHKVNLMGTGGGQLPWMSVRRVQRQAKARGTVVSRSSRAKLKSMRALMHQRGIIEGSGKKYLGNEAPPPISRSPGVCPGRPEADRREADRHSKGDQEAHPPRAAVPLRRSSIPKNHRQLPTHLTLTPAPPPPYWRFGSPFLSFLIGLI